MVRPKNHLNRLGRSLSAQLAFFLVGFLILMPVLAQSQAIDPLANVDRTTLVEGSQLTLRVRTRQTEHELDLAPLLRDFEVIAQAYSTNNPALTGLGTDFLEWEIILAPRRTGELTIPALTVGNRQTRP
ncbi:MAG: BatD family protein, partial [Natronospirillum sp.]